MPRVRIDGGLIGVTNSPTSGSAGGMWAFSEHSKYTRSASWPAASAPVNSINAIALVVAGGGGGGYNFGGGGGAGGTIFNSNLNILNSNYTITIGAGGTGSSVSVIPTSGTNTTAFGYTAVGGGAGGTTNDSTNTNIIALSGGSGGGARGYVVGTNTAKGTGTAGQGNDGGTSTTNAQTNGNIGGGGGGGGASAIGTSATTSQGGNGGAGIYSSISGSNTAYGGGGGGGGYSPLVALAGTGGVGGGGSGNNASNGSGAPGTAYTGGGGGGSGGGGGGGSGGNGGSGVVVLNYPAPQRYTGGTVTNVINAAGSNIVHTFTSSGSLNALGYSIDTYFPQTTLLLHGDGTVGANNTVFLDNSGANTYIPFNGTYSGYFGTSGSYLTITPTSALALGTGDWTYEFWIYWTGVTTTDADFYRIGSSDWAIGVYNSAASLGIVNFAGAERIYFGSKNQISVNTWTHVAFTRSGNSFRCFINGTIDSAGVLTSSASMFNTTGTATNLFKGFSSPVYISNARLIKGTALYTANFTPPTSALTAVSGTALLTCQSPLFVDNSTNNLTITQTGGPLITSGGVPVATNGKPQQGTFSPFSQTGWSTYFSGSTDKLTATVVAAGTGSVTYEAWVNLSTSYSSGNTLIFLNSRSGGTTDGIDIGVYTSNKLRITYTNLVLYTGSASLSVGVWYHIAVVRNGSSSWSVYINGMLDGTFTNSVNITSTTITIGNAVANDALFPGYISDVRVTNSAVYTGNFIPPITPLTTTNSSTVLLASNSNRFIGANSSVSNVAITVNNTPSVQPFSPYSPSSAYSNTSIGGSISFNGSTDYLSGTGDPFGALTGNFTVEFWVYKNDAWSASSQMIFDAGAASSMGVWVNTGSGTLRMSRSGVDAPIEFSYSTLAPKQWYHIAFVRSSTTLSMYVNGNRVNTVTSSASFATGTTFNIGRNTGASQYWNGYISNFRAVKGSAVYDPSQTTITVPTSPLTAVASTSLLLNATNAGIIDHTAKNTLTTYGSAAISSTQSKFGGTSMYFDGSTSVITAPYVSNFHSFHLSDYTVELWVYPLSYAGMSQGASALPTLIGGMLYNNNTSDWSFGMNTSGILKFTYWNGTATQSVTSSTTVPLNSWSHIAAVKTSSGISLYYNGTLAVGPTALSGTPSIQAGTFLTLGAYYNTYCNAYVDDVRISKYARYTTNFTPPTSTFLDR